MNEKPILFSGEMVRAILAGRKTQTRRIMKPSLAITVRCPYGKPGDRLWVRETFQPVQLASEVTQWRYRATDEKGLSPWTPSIFMPRKASRITLEITAIRYETLTAISNEDCFAEGLPAETTKGNRNWYGDLWEEINGPGSWAANPYVWVITFRNAKVSDAPDSAAPNRE